MDEVINNIKEYVGILDDNIAQDDYLDLIVREVVDRVLIYTNREQLIRDYESDVVDYPITDKTDTTETYYNFWKNYGYPIPPVLEKPIARVVLQTINSLEEDFKGREVKSMSDSGQSVTFGDEIQSYMASKEDSNIFMSIKYLLDKFRIPTI
jgi:hypothetical protein